MRKVLLPITIMLFLSITVQAAYLLLPMDKAQKNHLKAYGIAYWTLQQDVEVSWLLNYRGGSFMFRHHPLLEAECLIRGVTFQVIADVQADAILAEISEPAVNMD